MNNVQTTYVKKRIEEIYQENRAKIKAKYVWVKPVLTVNEKLALIAAGKFKFREGVENNRSIYNNSLDNGLIFEETQNPNLKAEAEAYAALNVERTRLLDELVLGDVEEALALLNNFAKKEF